MGTRYSKHLKRIETLTRFAIDENMKLVEVWECKYDRFRAKSEQLLADLITNGSIKPPLNQRDALFGVRTNAFVLYYKIKIEEKIKYYDLCSLYPFIQMYGHFQIGHPVLITENFTTVDKYFGLIKCKNLPL